MAKQNKIIVCVCTDDTDRLNMIKRLAVKKGLATTPGDAQKLIRQSPIDYDLTESYLVLASDYNLASSAMTTHQLYRMAVSGICIIVGAKRLQPAYEFMCEAYYQGEV